MKIKALFPEKEGIDDYSKCPLSSGDSLALVGGSVI